MTTVETYATLAEAARAMNGAAYMGGGTIVMREVNAGTAAARGAAGPRATDLAAHAQSLRSGPW